MDAQRFHSDELVSVVRRAHELANSGRFEGFNALVPALTAEFGNFRVERLRKDIPAKYAISDACQTAWRAKNNG
jgi:hypothetical protein